MSLLLVGKYLYWLSSDEPAVGWCRKHDLWLFGVILICLPSVGRANPYITCSRPKHTVHNRLEAVWMIWCCQRWIVWALSHLKPLWFSHDQYTKPCAFLCVKEENYSQRGGKDIVTQRETSSRKLDIWFKITNYKSTSYPFQKKRSQFSKLKVASQKMAKEKLCSYLQQ